MPSACSSTQIPRSRRRNLMYISSFSGKKSNHWFFYIKMLSFYLFFICRYWSGRVPDQVDQEQRMRHSWLAKLSCETLVRERIALALLFLVLGRFMVVTNMPYSASASKISKCCKKLCKGEGFWVSLQC